VTSTGGSPEASVGRSEELDNILTALESLEKGATAAVIITGESGIGKSHLLRQAAHRITQTGAVVLSGACLDPEDAPLGPLRQALRRLAAQPPQPAPRPGSRTAARSAVAPPSAARMLAVTELRELLDGHTAADASGLLERISTGLADIAEGRPIALILDDLQLIDRTTGRLLRYLLAGLGGVRLLLLGAARLDATQGDQGVRGMLSDLRRLPTVQVRQLPPLTRPDTERLAGMLAARRLGPAEATRLWERSGGNPFLVEALGRALRAAEQDLPETVRGIIRDRLDSLPPDALSVALAVAAGIEPVDHTLLGQVVPFGEVKLVDAIRVAMRAQVLNLTTEGYVFQLGLYREELETWHLPGERVLLHRAYAAALSTMDGEPQYARLAHHWRHAGEPARALPAAAKAAKDAERRYGYPEALNYWTTALEIIDRTPALSHVDRTAIARSAAEAAHRGDENSRSLELLDDLAKRLGEPLPAWLHTGRGKALAALSRLAEAETAYRLAIDAPAESQRERVMAAARSAELLLHMGRHAEAGTRARQALDLAHGLEGMTSTQVLAGTTLGFSQAFLDDAVAGRAAVQAAVDRAEASGSPEDIATAYQHFAKLLTEPLNELEEGIRIARLGARRAAEEGLARTHGASLLAMAANGLFRIGRWREAERLVAEAMSYSPSGTEAVEVLLAGCKVHLALGDLNGAERDLDALETLTFGGGPHHVLGLRTLRAGLAMWRGRYGDARRAVQQGVDACNGRTDNVVVLATLVWHGLRTEAEARTKGTQGVDGEAVRRLRGLVETLAAVGVDHPRPVRAMVGSYVALCRAELGRIDNRPDPAAWEQAATEWDRLCHPYPAVYARLRQADAYFFKRVDSAKGVRCLRAAHAGAMALEARPMIKEIQELAARHRVTFTGPVRGRLSSRGRGGRGPAGGRPGALATLTDREYEVLGLVARFMTNKQIAQALFIADRTVSAHVRSILAKLEVPRRAQAAAIYQQANQAEPPPDSAG
jgi:DNA-binding CsgD family transcriptional regulator